MAAKSGWKQRAIIYVSRNSFIRRTYTELKNAPLFGPALQKLVKAMVPSGTRVWRVGRGHCSLKGCVGRLSQGKSMSFMTGWYTSAFQSN